MNTAAYNQNFQRTVQKSDIPTCNIMGVDIAAAALFEREYQRFGG